MRVLCNLKSNEYWMETILHELGHGVYDKYLDYSTPYLLRSPAHSFTTEAMAMFFGRLSRNPAWMQQMLGLSDAQRAEIEKVGGKYAQLKQLIFARWDMVMYYFEKELYANPDQDLTKLWWDLVEKYQLVKRPPDRTNPDWAAKIHFAVAPCYYHNYMLGELLASQWHHTLVNKVLGPQVGQRRQLRRPEEGRPIPEREGLRGRRPLPVERDDPAFHRRAPDRQVLRGPVREIEMKAKKTAPRTNTALVQRGGLVPAVAKVATEIRDLIEAARRHVSVTANLAMVSLYWNIGRIVAQDIQKNEKRAEYGTELMEQLAVVLTRDYGQGYSVNNLRDMKRFFDAFVIRQPVSAESAVRPICSTVSNESQIPQTVSGESSPLALVQPLAGQAKLKRICQTTSSKSAAGKILQTASGESCERLLIDFRTHFRLGWSHYRLLLSQSDPLCREILL